MKFKSRKDLLFQLVFIGIISLCFGIVLLGMFQREQFNFLWIDVLMILVAGFLFWLYFGTGYHLTPRELKYKSGPISGKIQLDEIREIIKGKTLWSGLKPATARNGLIIRYGKFYDEIYISPDSNDTFLNKILELNDNIKITGE